MKQRLIIIIILCLLLITGSSSRMMACPVCYGSADNSTMDAANTAVWTLLGITGFVLFSVVAFSFFVWKRTKRLREQIFPDSFIDDNGIIHLKNNKGIIEWNNS
ncbi:MAG: hypothetical protein HYZ34_10255 [Ignavibacteriae bacterium]|nr:hypothetical protein [Ignavibacteriota bacterium]